MAKTEWLQLANTTIQTHRIIILKVTSFFFSSNQKKILLTKNSTLRYKTYIPMKSPNGTNNPKTKIKTNTRATTENKIYSHTTNWRKDKTQRSKNQKERKKKTSTRRKKNNSST
jgi:hypothetical protein